METIKGKHVTIKADEGMKLTQAADVAIENRIVADTIYLAVNDSPDNWREITETEADAIIAEQEKIERQSEG